MIRHQNLYLHIDSLLPELHFLLNNITLSEKKNIMKVLFTVVVNLCGPHWRNQDTNHCNTVKSY